MNKAQKDTSDLALQSDGSKAKSGASAAVVWKNASNYRWNIRNISLGKNKEIYDAELWGILEALKIALRKSINRKICRVTVFSDSQTAFKQLQNVKCNAGQALKSQIFKLAKQLYNWDGEVILRWVPSHKRIKRNDKADNTAKDTAANGRSQTARWSSLTHVNRKINKAKQSEIHSWYQTRNKERERKSQNYYTLCFKPEIHPVLGHVAKNYASRFFQLKVGYGVVGVLLERIRVVETAKC